MDDYDMPFDGMSEDVFMYRAMNEDGPMYMGDTTYIEEEYIETVADDDYDETYAMNKSQGPDAYTPDSHSSGDTDFKRPTKHSMHRRSYKHDYSEPGTYLITIAIEGRLPLFGELVSDGKPFVRLSELGYQVRDIEVPKIREIYPMVDVWRLCIMPDHLHMIVHVSAKMPFKKHLGNVIGAFKGGCSRAWWDICGYTDPNDRKPIFEDGYNDGILMDDAQLAGWKRYLIDNPRRLALKRKNPDLFKIWHSVTIGIWECQMIGNIFLLDIPDSMAVIVHRSDSDDTFADKFNGWMACGERGGVLVSAAIAKREKLVMREAMNRGYRLIVLRENGFHKYYKPAGESFDACAEGRMLQICPWEYHTDNRTIRRDQCLELNRLACCISNGH